MIISGQIKNRISSWTQPWVKTPPPKYLLAKSTCNKNVCKSLKHVLFFHWTKKGTRLVYFEACVVFSLNQKKYKAKYKFHRGIIIYPHLKCHWNQTMLNLCSIVVAILKMATGRHFSMSGINSGHHNLPTYEMALKSDNVEFVWYCGDHFENGNH
jgi:hypothetical protein